MLSIVNHSVENTKDTRAAYDTYKAVGGETVPVPPGRKGPNIANFYDVTFAREHFNAGSNIGIKNGVKSGGLVAIDADTDVSRMIWKKMYGGTLTSGRRAYSHWWYYVTGYDPQAGIKSETQRFTNPEKKNLYEFRADGSQTLVFPSTHPSGDRYEWGEEFDPAKITKITEGELRRRVKVAYTASLIAERMPKYGRHDYLLAAAGLLLATLGFDQDEAYEALDAAWEVTGAYSSDDPHKTAKEVADAIPHTAEKMDAGEPVTGAGRLDELATAPISGLIKKVWGIKRNRDGDKPTDDELRDRFIERHPDHAHGQDEWKSYGGGIWTPEHELTVKRGVSEVVEDAKPEGIRPTAALVSSVSEMAKIKLSVPHTLWDANPEIVVCENRVLELPTSTLRDHSRRDYTTQRLPYSYDPEADCEVWRNFVSRTLPEERDFVQEFAGYCLTTDTALEMALWLVGTRGSGKSTFLEGLIAMLGHRAGRLGLREIEQSRFGLTGIQGKTLLVASEQPSAYLQSTDVLDSIISGEPITVDRKYREPVTVRPHAKIVWAMNDLPRIGNTTSGIFRRVKVVKFPEPTGKPNPLVKEIIKTESAGILNWALQGLTRLRNRGSIVVPGSVAAATQEFQNSNDVPGMFFEECIVPDPSKSIGGGDLYLAYREWCFDNGHKPLSSARAAHEWERLGLTRIRSGGKTTYHGGDLRG